jgi:hypothetical protein
MVLISTPSFSLQHADMVDSPLPPAPIRARTTLSFAPLQDDISRPPAPTASPAEPVSAAEINFRLLMFHFVLLLFNFQNCSCNMSAPIPDIEIIYHQNLKK